MSEFTHEEFSPFIDLYKIDKRGELVKSGTLNRQAAIDEESKSCYENWIKAQQEYEFDPGRYSALMVDDTEIVMNNFTGDLLDMEEFADELREKYGLNEMSVTQIFEWIKRHAEEEQALKEEVKEDETAQNQQESVEA